MLLKVYLITLLALSISVPFWLAFFVEEKEEFSKDTENRLAFSAIVGGCCIFWPLVIVLLFLLLLNMTAATLGGIYYYKHRNNKEKKISIKVRKEAKLKQEKLAIKIGD